MFKEWICGRSEHRCADCFAEVWEGVILGERARERERKREREILGERERDSGLLASLVASASGQEPCHCATGSSNNCRGR